MMLVVYIHLIVCITIISFNQLPCLVSVICLYIPQWT